jgi:integrase
VVGGKEFARWSGIQAIERPRRPAGGDAEAPGRCFRFLEQRRAGQSRAFERPHWICEIDPGVGLATSREVEWALDEPRFGRQALRVAVGRGRVTVINAEPFRSRRLFDGDHGWLLAAAAELRPGDAVHFLTEADYPPLLALIWQNGAPVVVLGLAVLGLVLWRGGVRIGPLAAIAAPVRRSLAEQIRGTGRFALLHDGGEPLHAAAARALDEAARTRVGGYGALAPRDRVSALAGLAGVAPAALDAALHDSRERSPHELRATVALLETVRRSLIRQKRTGHGIR